MDYVPLKFVHPTMHQPLNVIGIDTRVVLNNSNPNEKSFSKLRKDGTQNKITLLNERSTSILKLELKEEMKLYSIYCEF
jgi:hypothetical protein